MDNNYKKQLHRRYITGLLMTFGLLTILSVMMFSSGLVAAENISVSNSTKTIFLVRHGEKQTGKDPLLTDQGQQRASRLAQMLSSVPLSSIYSTNYQRTLLTAQPTSALSSINVTTYDPRLLSSFAEKLKSNADSHILIVGHSNTTPELVNLLGGDAGKEINEKSEFDRLYVLTMKNGEVNTLLLRY